MKPKEKAWGLCESCRLFDQKKARCSRANEEDDLISRESWPGAFSDDRCVKCSMYRDFEVN